MDELAQLKKNKDMAESFYSVYKDRVDALGKSDLASVEELVRHAKVLDDINEQIYLIEKQQLLVPTKTLKEEERRLKDLVAFIDERDRERNRMIKEVQEYTGVAINDLNPIDDAKNKDNYYQRQHLINTYFDNVENVKSISREIKEDEIRLKIENQEKMANEEKNHELEIELKECYQEIMNSFKGNDLNLGKLKTQVEEYGKLLDITMGTYEIRRQKNEMLPDTSKDLDKERELYDKVMLAKTDYYNHKEQLYYLLINDLVSNMATDYDSMFRKREKILDLVDERRNDRKKCNIKGANILSMFSELVTRQLTVVNSQLRNKNLVDSLTIEIQNKKDMIDKLKDENKTPIMTNILKEYHEQPNYEENEVESVINPEPTVANLPHFPPKSVINIPVEPVTIPVIESATVPKTFEQEIMAIDDIPAGVVIDNQKAKLMATKIAVALGYEYHPQPTEIKIPTASITPKVVEDIKTNPNTVQSALSSLGGINLPPVGSLDEMIGDQNEK